VRSGGGPRRGPQEGSGGGADPPFHDHFSATAADYARFRPDYPVELVDALVALVPGADLAWDAGCGSGQFSVLLGRRFRRVIATDASRDQIDRALPDPAVEYRVAPAEASGVEAGSADLVTAAQAAHWFDLEAFYGEVRRVARAGGVLALVTYGAPELDGEPGGALRDFHVRALAGHWPPQRRLVDRGYRDLPFPFPELEVPSFEHRARWTLDHLLGYVGTWSGVRRLLEAGGEEVLVRFRGRMEEAWGEPSRLRAVRWPIRVRAGRVRPGGA
jgi:SAM-dependent methyltransferase